MPDHRQKIVGVIIRRRRRIGLKPGQKLSQNAVQDRYDTLTDSTEKRQKPVTNTEMTSSGDLPGSAPYCFATIVVDKALEALLASGADAQIKDDHPWLVAQRDFLRAEKAGLKVALLLAKQSASPDADVHQCEFSHWGFVKRIEVLELSGKRFSTRVELNQLSEISPLFTSLDSVCVKPPDEQLLREEVESVRTQRVTLREQYLRPYALCEAPGFIPRLTPWLYPTLEV